MPSVIVDAAGAAMGGASRLLSELDAYLAGSGRTDVSVVGTGRALDPAWLASRELLVARSRGSRRIALNNVSFVGGGGHRTVLLRNALHFPIPGESGLLPPGAERRVALQARAVRAASRRADLLVTPSSSMAGRVQRWLPATSSRTVVWPHPVSPRKASLPRESGLVVCPVLFAPYKRMGHWLRLLADAAEVLRRDGAAVSVEVTATADELAAEGLESAGLVALGRLTVDEVDRALSRAFVVFFPTTVESFGYPLAEARVNGQAVLAPDTPHNREVAGPALAPFEPTTHDLASVLGKALSTRVCPSPVEAPEQYFDRLLRVP